MAIRLSNSLRNNSSAGQEQTQTGFSLTFTEGNTYNLDDIWANHDRSSTEKELMLQVKHYDEVSQEVIDVMKEKLGYQIVASLNEKQDEIQAYFAQMTSKIFQMYGCNSKNISLNAQADLNREMNEYLKSLINRGASYTVKFKDSGNAIITYSFKGDASLKDKYIEYYRQFAKEYDNKISVSEGGLAIEDTVKKNTANSLDYKKYLLTEKSTKGYVAPVTTKRPVIVWENGTDDTTSEEDTVSNIYVEFEKYKETTDAVIEGLSKISEGAPEQYNTLKKISDALADLEEDIAAYNNIKISDHISKEDEIQDCITTVKAVRLYADSFLQDITDDFNHDDWGLLDSETAIIGDDIILNGSIETDGDSILVPFNFTLDDTEKSIIL